jgi:hypothetical protein
MMFVILVIWIRVLVLAGAPNTEVHVHARKSDDAVWQRLLVVLRAALVASHLVGVARALDQLERPASSAVPEAGARRAAERARAVARHLFEEARRAGGAHAGAVDAVHLRIEWPPIEANAAVERLVADKRRCWRLCGAGALRAVELAVRWPDEPHAGEVAVCLASIAHDKNAAARGGVRKADRAVGHEALVCVVLRMTSYTKPQHNNFSGPEYAF